MKQTVSTLCQLQPATYIGGPKSVHTWNNICSYNYLGYAQTEGECIEAAVEAVATDGLASCSPDHEVGRRKLHQELEETVAEFLGY